NGGPSRRGGRGRGLRAVLREPLEVDRPLPRGVRVSHLGVPAGVVRGPGLRPGPVPGAGPPALYDGSRRARRERALHGPVAPPHAHAGRARGAEGEPRLRGPLAPRPALRERALLEGGGRRHVPGGRPGGGGRGPEEVPAAANPDARAAVAKNLI